MAGEVPFRELVRYAIGGGWGTDEPTADSLPVRVIRGTDFANIASGTFDEIPRRFEVRAKVERRLLQANDIVLEISGGSRTSNQTTGRTLFVTKTILDRFEEPVIPASFCRLVRVRDDVVVPRYAYFVLQEMYKSGRAGLYEHHSTGISNFQFEYFLDQEVVWLPPLPEQRAIAHILGTLDDKIELNRRMSQTLEAMARALFKAWFVDFEPVRAKLEGRWQAGQSLPGLPAELYDLFPDRLVDSELGQIPEGWEVGTINDICSSIENGGTPRRMETQYWNGSIPWFKTGELTDGPLLDSEEKITEIGLAKSSCKLWPTKTILVALYASPTVGRLGILETSATANQACSGLIAKANYGYLYLFYSLLFSRDRLQKIAVGAAQQNISQQVLRQHKIIIASSVIAQFFHRHVEAAYQYQVLLIAESRALAGLCDALLPKLIRGEMRVRDAERFLEQRGL